MTILICSLHLARPSAGLVSLEVAEGGQVISKSVIFKYKEQNGAKSTVTKDNSNTCMKEKYLRTLLLQKLEVLDICSILERDLFLEQPLESKVKLELIFWFASVHKCKFWLLHQENLTEFEDRLVAVCQKLTQESGAGMCDEDRREDRRQADTSLLHLSASLGLTRLTCSLLHWAAEWPGRRLAREVDALAQDSEGFTPLVSERDNICKPSLLLYKEHTMVISCLMYLMSVNTEENKWIIIPLCF